MKQDKMQLRLAKIKALKQEKRKHSLEFGSSAISGNQTKKFNHTNYVIIDGVYRTLLGNKFEKYVRTLNQMLYDSIIEKANTDTSIIEPLIDKFEGRINFNILEEIMLMEAFLGTKFSQKTCCDIYKKLYKESINGAQEFWSAFDKSLEKLSVKQNEKQEEERNQ